MRKKEREITDIQDIESIIMKSDVCRIALSDGNVPYIVTMNFGYSRGEINCLWFHCANEGRKLDIISKNNYVCFEMDTDHEINGGPQACDYGMKYSSVVGYGYISIVTDINEKIKGLDCIMSHITGIDRFTYKPESLERVTLLRLDIEEMSGKRVQ